jgi:hypothetical protein
MKRPYQKPAIERIDMAGEMQTTSGCKSVTFTNSKLIGKTCDVTNACKNTLGS